MRRSVGTMRLPAAGQLRRVSAADAVTGGTGERTANPQVRGRERIGLAQPQRDVVGGPRPVPGGGGHGGG